MKDTLNTSAPVIEPRDLNLAFHTGNRPVHALKDVNLTINRGDFVSFIGPSGCGPFHREIVVLDPHKTKTIAAKTKKYVINYNVFKGKFATGLPRPTLMRGHVAIADGGVKTREGHGRFVARPPNGAVNRALTQWKDLTAPGPVVWSGISAGGV